MQIRELDSEKTKLIGALEEERQARRTSERLLSARMDSLATSLQTELELQQRQREKQTEVWSQRISAVEQSLLEAIESEGRERSQTESGFIDLLEGTCERLERAMFNN